MGSPSTARPLSEGSSRPYARRFETPKNPAKRQVHAPQPRLLAVRARKEIVVVEKCSLNCCAFQMTQKESPPLKSFNNFPLKVSAVYMP